MRTSLSGEVLLIYFSILIMVTLVVVANIVYSGQSNTTVLHYVESPHLVMCENGVPTYETFDNYLIVTCYGIGGE